MYKIHARQVLHPEHNTTGHFEEGCRSPHSSDLLRGLCHISDVINHYWNVTERERADEAETMRIEYKFEANMYVI